MNAIHAAVPQNSASLFPLFQPALSAQYAETDYRTIREISLYRLPQVLARIPISRSAWYAGISSGLYPRPFSLGPRTAVWRSDEIDLVVLSLINRRSKP